MADTPEASREFKIGQDLARQLSAAIERNSALEVKISTARSALEKARTYIEYALDTHGNDVAGTGLAALNAIDATLAQEPAGQSEVSK